jgi:hypothetical protein
MNTKTSQVYAMVATTSMASVIAKAHLTKTEISLWVVGSGSNMALGYVCSLSFCWHQYLCPVSYIFTKYSDYSQFENLFRFMSHI